MECIELRLNKHDVKRHEYSDRISDRRKALFPVDNDNSDSDLGPMSPLSDVSTNLAHNLDLIDLPQNISMPNRIINDYIIFQNEVDTSVNSNNIVLQEKSPIQNNPDASLVCYETPIKESPTKNLKTPHESFNTTVKVPRIPRKSNLDSSSNDIDLDVDGNSPEGLLLNKSVKLDTSCTKNSKVRTALFPESELTLSVKNFYSENKTSLQERPHRDYLMDAVTTENTSKPAPLYLCARRAKTKKRFGQINAGVRHSIRKPKQKKISKTKILQTALNIIENSPLNDYLANNCQNSQETNKTITSDVPQKVASENSSTFVLSPELEEANVLPDPNKKFFKSTRMQGTVTVNKNIKLQVSKGKINLIQNSKTKRKEDTMTLDASDLTVCESDQLLSKVNITNILSMLEDDKENHQENNVATCQDRKRKHLDQSSESAELLLSPTSQMCDMASGLAINSPKRAKLNISKILDITTNETAGKVFNKTTTADVKLFPIFCSSYKPQMKSPKPNKASDPKQWKPVAKDQMLLDAGQKRFGTTQCPECEIIYNMGDPNDEIMHLYYHNAGHILRFNGWKHENIVVINKNDRIIKICPGDPKVWWKKVNDLMEVVNKDLGCYDNSFNFEKTVVFLYIKQKCIAGCLVVQPKSQAYMMLPDVNGIDICSEESYPIKCGVSHIWVAQGYRKQGIGTALLNSLRMNYMYGYILRNEDIAFSSPTEVGKSFAIKYFKTTNYLVYMP